MFQGFFSRGPPYRILQAWRDGRVRLIISSDILDEYTRVSKILAKQFPSVELQPFIDLVTATAEMVPSVWFAEPLCDDPADDMFIACALTAKCKIIISGDKHLLKMSGFHKIEILSPRAFVDKYLGSS